MPVHSPSHRLTAILGPTNTGKTFMAMERMLGHRSGMIGFPLRLLARENYDRAVAAMGREAVALVTGEEKIRPSGARYILATVEAMPIEKRVDFLAIDEIQLAADPERGHIFTDRLLHARGEAETMVMGADRMAPWVKMLMPGVEIVTRPRFSNLTHAGQRKITRLAPRSAIVAFSAADVYAIADLIRRQRGGAAIVMGALSPRTRNAQVALYQSGEIDYLVATDAIGMGLNMDVRHVAFAALRKFDGRMARFLSAAEIGQIAGRAGRHMTDGTFGTTGSAGALDPAIAAAIEAHRFDPIPYLAWRNSDLDFRSPAHLLASLDRPPPYPGLVRQSEAEDHLSLKYLLRDGEILDLARDRRRLRLLWEVCQVPDFRKLMTDAHVRLLGQIYRHLSDRAHLPPDWVADQMARLDRIDGDIDQLTQRIAYTRTWSYIANRGDWLLDSPTFQARAQRIEDRLSDALHAALTQRFVDRRHAALQRRQRDGEKATGSLSADGTLEVAGHIVGRLVGLRFLPDLSKPGDAAALLSAARRTLAPAIARAVGDLIASPDRDFRWREGGILEWRGDEIAEWRRGESALDPALRVFANDWIEPRDRQAIERKLRDWFSRYRRRHLKPIFDLTEAPDLSPAARGLAYSLSEAFGALPRRQAASALAALSAKDRRRLRALGLEFGREFLYLPRLEEKSRRRLLRALAALWLGLPAERSGAMGEGARDEIAHALYDQARGRRIIAGREFSFPALEKLSHRLAALCRKGRLSTDPAIARSFGFSPEAFGALLIALHYRLDRRSGMARFGEEKKAPPTLGTPPPDPASPFAVLAGLKMKAR